MKIVVTRPRGSEGSLVRGIQALGHDVVHCPLIEVEPIGDEPVDVSGYDWVIVTSVSGARELRRRMVGSPRRVAAIGAATAEAFGGADLVPAVSTQEGLLAELPRPAGRVLFAGAEGARRLLVDELGATFVPLYRTRELTPVEPPAGDLVVLASASAARAFGRLAVASPGRQHRASDHRGGARARGRGRRRGSDARRRRARGGDNLSRVFVTFLSDFGLKDDFVGICHGVIKQIAPETEIIDVTHGIPRQQVLQGALVLAKTLPYLPVGVHLAVVDPGVGGSRRPLALRDRDGRFFVGPDNGLLVPAADRAGIDAAYELANPEYALDSISRTFHGRDLFAPAAAHLSRGVAIEELGPPLAVDALVRLDLPQPEVRSDRIAATVLYVDTYGNVALNVTRDDVAQAGIVPGTQVELELAGERFYALATRTFADARPGDIMLYEDSYRNMSVAIRNGSAAEMLHARAGQSIRINVGRI